MWIEDLASYDGAQGIVAVGWLERSRPYPTGVVDVAVFEKLAALLTDPWQRKALLAAGGGILLRQPPAT